MEARKSVKGISGARVWQADETTATKFLRWEPPYVFDEQQGGRCGLCGMSAGKDTVGSDEKAERWQGWLAQVCSDAVGPCMPLCRHWLLPWRKQQGNAGWEAQKHGLTYITGRSLGPCWKQRERGARVVAVQPGVTSSVLASTDGRYTCFLELP